MSSQRTKRRRKIRSYPTHDVQQQWRERWRGMRTDRDVGRQVKRAPYGTHLGYPMEWNEDKQQFKSIGLAKQLPIQGPPNWDQLWSNWTDIGTDHTLPHDPEESPLPPLQMPKVNELSDKYEVESWIGRLAFGGFGSVWMIRCHRKDVVGAQQEWLACKGIKAVRVNLDGTKTTMIRAIKSMLQDIHICSSLSHSNIMPYLEVITIPDEQTHFPFSSILIFMPLCHGDMTDMLTHIGTFTTRMCQHWMRQIAPAVRYMHERDIGAPGH